MNIRYPAFFLAFSFVRGLFGAMLNFTWHPTADANFAIVSNDGKCFTSASPEK